jgi:hypothetical protein
MLSDVRYECNRGGSFIALGGQCYRLKGSLYLPRAVSIFLENDGEKFQFMSEGILDTNSLGCVSGKTGLIVCLQDGEVNPGVDKDWYEWASNRLCDLRSHPVSGKYQYPKMEGGLLLLFRLHTEYMCAIH